MGGGLEGPRRVPREKGRGRLPVWVLRGPRRLRQQKPKPGWRSRPSPANGLSRFVSRPSLSSRHPTDVSRFHGPEGSNAPRARWHGS